MIQFQGKVLSETKGKYESFYYQDGLLKLQVIQTKECKNPLKACEKAVMSIQGIKANVFDYNGGTSFGGNIVAFVQEFTEVK